MTTSAGCWCCLFPNCTKKPCITYWIRTDLLKRTNTYIQSKREVNYLKCLHFQIRWEISVPVLRTSSCINLHSEPEGGRALCSVREYIGQPCCLPNGVSCCLLLHRVTVRGYLICTVFWTPWKELLALLTAAEENETLEVSHSQEKETSGLNVFCQLSTADRSTWKFSPSSCAALKLTLFLTT